LSLARGPLDPSALFFLKTERQLNLVFFCLQLISTFGKKKKLQIYVLPFHCDKEAHSLKIWGRVHDVFGQILRKGFPYLLHFYQQVFENFPWRVLLCTPTPSLHLCNQKGRGVKNLLNKAWKLWNTPSIFYQNPKKPPQKNLPQPQWPPPPYWPFNYCASMQRIKYFNCASVFRLGFNNIFSLSSSNFFRENNV
jgi:hypothetical protein